MLLTLKSSQLDRLNASFVSWLTRQKMANPTSDYTKGLQDYVKYARQALEEQVRSCWERSEKRFLRSPPTI